MSDSGGEVAATMRSFVSALAIPPACIATAVSYASRNTLDPAAVARASKDTVAPGRTSAELSDTVRFCGRASALGDDTSKLLAQATTFVSSASVPSQGEYTSRVDLGFMDSVTW